MADIEARCHHSGVALHVCLPRPSRAQLLAALQQHCLAMWDLLHEFGLNHFGRLIHFAQGPVGGTAQGADDALPPAHAPAPAAATAPSAAAAVADVEQAQLPLSHPSSPSDPFLHDWAQVAIMLQQSLDHVDAPSIPKAAAAGAAAGAGQADFPERAQQQGAAVAGPSSFQGMAPAARALIQHVIRCVSALRVGLETDGTQRCLATLRLALTSLHAFLRTGAVGGEGGSTHAQTLLRRMEEAAGESPLMKVVLATAAAAQQGQEEGGEGEGRQQRSVTAASVEIIREWCETAAELSAAGQAPPGGVHAVVLAEGAGLQEMQGALEAARGSMQLTIATLESQQGGSRAAAPPAPPEGDKGAAALPAGRVTLLTPDEVCCALGAEILSHSDLAIWHAAGGVVHVSGSDVDSPALSLLQHFSGPGAGAGPECHIMATATQVLALEEARRADHLLKVRRGLGLGLGLAFVGRPGRLTTC